MIMAIDPGANGGIAYKNGNSATAACLKMPDTNGDIWETLDAIAIGARLENNQETPVCYLEDLVKYTGRNMPSSAMATYARNFGFIEGVLTALSFRIVLTKPKDWQKALGLGSASGLSKTQWKNKLKAEAQRRFPGIKVTLATSDALLILEYACKNT